MMCFQMLSVQIAISMVYLVYKAPQGFSESSTNAPELIRTETLGVDFTKLWAPSKKTPAHSVCQKFALQFHQLNVKANIMSKFAKYCLPFAKFVRQKKLLILPAQKSREKMLMKSTPDLWRHFSDHSAYTWTSRNGREERN